MVSRRPQSQRDRTARTSRRHSAVDEMQLQTVQFGYRIWAQCRVSQRGVGVYCYMNTAAGYAFDTRDPANPRVIGPKPLRKPQTRH